MIDKNELQKEVDTLAEKGQWNCYYKFPNGVVTRTEHINSPGYNINKWKRLEPILKSVGVKDKSVVDIGCGDGFYCIETSKLTNKEVLGTDIDPLRIKRGKLAKKVYNIDNVDFKNVDLYKDELQDYDIVMGLGLLHRIPNVEECLKRMTEIGNVVILEFKTSSKKDKNEFGGGKSKSNEFNKLYHLPTKEYIENIMNENGFKCIKIEEDKSHLNHKRPIMVFKREV